MFRVSCDLTLLLIALLAVGTSSILVATIVMIPRMITLPSRRDCQICYHELGVIRDTQEFLWTMNTALSRLLYIHQMK